MAELGRWNQLAVLRLARPGVYLDGGGDGEILMPRRYVPDEVEEGTVLEVFVYRDSEDRLVATTEKPLAMVGEFAALRVLSTQANLGAFLDWGLAKDLLLPRREQTASVREGQLVVVRIAVDERSQRIVASQRLHRFLDKSRPDYRPEQEVSLFVTNETPLGYNAIVNGKHQGLIFQSSLSGPLTPGETLPGYVRAVHPDGKIDLALDRAGYVRVKPLSENILQALADAGGSLPLHDRSSPEEIRQAFGVSKKAFKQAVGALYRRRAIELSPTAMKLAPETFRPKAR